MIIPGTSRKNLKVIRVLGNLRNVRGLSIDEANTDIASVQPGSAVGSRPVGGGSKGTKFIFQRTLFDVNPSDPTYIQGDVENGH